jgi:hypothetical protein
MTGVMNRKEVTFFVVVVQDKKYGLGEHAAFTLIGAGRRRRNMVPSPPFGAGENTLP